jgi:hypothetical protein
MPCPYGQGPTPKAAARQAFARTLSREIEALLEVGSWKLGVWELEVGSWELIV